MTGNLSVQEVQYKKVMGILGVIFLLSLGIFAVRPDLYTFGVNVVAGWFNQPEAPIVERIESGAVNAPLYLGAKPPENAPERPYSDRSYVAHACASLLAVTAICFLGFINPRKSYQYVPFAFFLLAASSVFGLLFYFLVARHFVLLFNPIADLICTLVMLVVWLRARGPAKTETGAI